MGGTTPRQAAQHWVKKQSKHASTSDLASRVLPSFMVSVLSSSLNSYPDIPQWQTITS